MPSGSQSSSSSSAKTSGFGSKPTGRSHSECSPSSRPYFATRLLALANLNRSSSSRPAPGLAGSPRSTGLSTSSVATKSTSSRPAITTNRTASGPNKALKMTRLSACQLGGPGSAENAAAHWLCTQSAVQLSAGVRPPGQPGVRLNRVANGPLDWPVSLLFLCKRLGRTASRPRRARPGHCEVLAGAREPRRFSEVRGARVATTGGASSRERHCVLGGLA